MMNENERRRFQALQLEYVSYEEAEAILWIRPDHPFLLPVLRSFGDLVQPGRPIFQNGTVSRYMLEICLQHFLLVPFPRAAARLGMTVESLKNTLQAMIDAGRMTPSALSMTSPTVGQKIVDDMHKQFRALQHRVFGDHNDYCESLHHAIQAELGVAIEPAWCTTSRALTPPKNDYAYTLCMISGEPTAVQNQVYLNFKKPLRLPPDVCSRRVYARNRSTLRPHAFTDEDVAGLPGE